MFRETEQGETQYCPMCEEWAEKYERLQAKNEELKQKLHSLNCNGNCSREKQMYKKALEEIREILCEGRTFYEGYFDSEHLGRQDKAIKKINEVLG